MLAMDVADQQVPKLAGVPSRGSQRGRPAAAENWALVVDHERTQQIRHRITSRWIAGIQDLTLPGLPTSGQVRASTG